MKFIVCSESPIKLAAVRAALKERYMDAEVVGVKVTSDVAEQPVGVEVLKGAKNRIIHARKLHPDADGYIAIENGGFLENGRCIDRAVVVISAKDTREYIEYSRSTEFPREYVDEARRQGFDKTTVGKVMAAAGVVKNHEDPHADIGDRTPRAKILQDAVSSALSKTLSRKHAYLDKTATKRVLD